MTQLNRLTARWIIAVITVITTAMTFIIASPTASAEEYATTTGVSPDGKQYSIGWQVPSGQESGFRSTRSARDYSFETKKLDNGMQTLIHIANSEAPTEYRFPLRIPDGAKVIPFTKGSADSVGIFLNGDLLATIATPWAHDANGTPLETSLTVENGTLVQIVEHDPSSAFPIIADPQIDWGWEQTTIKLSAKETQGTGLAGGAGALAALPWMAVLGVSGPVGMLILGSAAKLSYDATRAHRHGKCLGIVVNTNLASSNSGISTFEYGCS